MYMRLVFELAFAQMRRCFRDTAPIDTIAATVTTVLFKSELKVVLHTVSHCKDFLPFDLSLVGLTFANNNPLVRLLFQLLID
jgi:hypothetical protein